eukprot:4952740-Prymnesium_polylepis.2
MQGKATRRKTTWRARECTRRDTHLEQLHARLVVRQRCALIEALDPLLHAIVGASLVEVVEVEEAAQDEASVVRQRLLERELPVDLAVLAVVPRAVL